MKLSRVILSMLLLLSILKGALPLALLLGNVNISADNQLVIENADEYAHWEHFLAELCEKIEEKEEKKEEKKEGNGERESSLESEFLLSLCSKTLMQSVLACCESVQWHCAHVRYADIHSEQARLAYLFTHHLKVQC